MNQFTETHPGHPLSNAYGLMKGSKTKADNRDFFLMARAMIQLLKYQGQLTESEAASLFDDVDCQAAGGRSARSLQ
ncbi:hypothetical protein QPM17_03745 [Marinobacter sp. TBZ242]|uniref:Uncharacterized protein n=1 Tax=Marinobacter azerbaijanicus TaxID=3050455 RepID=A0ABT7I7T6_9GAMM|nr:hypothetical protein [Marinobacter sp. TBZ242]MDL0430222.1 hypothetical protein [Marinobacter sp. TBZ242]